MKYFPIAVMIISLSAQAADFSAIITLPDGSPMTSCEAKTPECERSVTLGSIASTALFATFPDEQDPRSPIPPEEKVKRAALGLRLRLEGKEDLTAEDTALVKKIIGKAYGPLTVYRAWALLDPASVATR